MGLFRKNSFFAISIVFILLSISSLFLLSLYSPHAYATQWNQIFTDNFNRSNSSTLGNNWTDTTGGVFSINNDQLNGTATGTPVNNELLRPVGEESTDQRATINFLGSAVGANSQVWLSLRTQTPGTEYILGYNGSLYIGDYLNESTLNIFGSQTVSALTGSDTYTLDASAVGTSPTTLTLTLTDDTTSTLVATYTQSDSTTALQTAGRAGLFINSGNNGTVVTLSTFSEYNDNAPTWTQQTSDNFNRANSAVVGDNWIDTTGGVYSINGNQLNALVTGSNPINNILLRPASEDTIDQRESINFLGSAVTSAQIWLALRTQTPGTEYILGYNGSLTIGDYIGESAVNVFGTSSVSINSGHTYTLTATATGTSATTLTLSLYDDTSSTLVGSTTQTDSTASLQKAGQEGLFVNSGSSGTTVALGNYVSYIDNASSAATDYTLTGPSSINLNQTSSNFAACPNGTYTGTITPNDGGAGGTFTPSSLTFSGLSDCQTFTYSPSSSGTKTISTTSSPSLSNPSGLSTSVTDPTATISITNSNLDWSPYNWHFNGSTFAETQAGGGYVKVAFTGSTLGLNIDTSAEQVDLSQIIVDTFIDGSSTPISKNLSQASGNLLTITNSLSSGNHYAVIYLSNTPCNCNNRYDEGQNNLRVTSLQLANDGSGHILSLSGTPLQKEATKILIYGDSITEGYNTELNNISTAETEYSADLGRSLGVEYGQVGYRAGAWNQPVDAANADFYNIGDTAGSWWANYDNAESRFNTPNVPSSGLLDGTPDAVYNNLGVNDYYGTTSSSLMTTKITDWLTDMRSALGSRPAIFMVVPFDFGNTGNSAEQVYKTAWLAGITNYETANPGDTRVFVVDLGVNGYNIVQANSGDGVHPNATAATSLAALIQTDTSAEISTVLQAGTISSAATAASTKSYLTTTAPTGGIAPYSYKWYRSTSNGFTPGPSNIISGATSNTLDDTGLTPDTTYYYKVVYGDSTNPDQSLSSSQFTVQTQNATIQANSSSSSSETVATPTSATAFTGTSSSSLSNAGINTPTTVNVSDVNGQPYIAGKVLGTSSKPTISGVAPPYSQVTVTFHSVAETCETNADMNGNWSCTLGQSLSSGTHYVDISAVTPDGQTMTFPQFEILVASGESHAINLTSTAIPKVDSTKKNDSKIYWLISVAAVLLLSILIKRRRTKSKVKTS